VLSVAAVLALAAACSSGSSASGTSTAAASGGASTSSANTAPTSSAPSAPVQSGSAAPGGGATENITISYSEKTGDEIALWIAHDAGYFQQDGLNVTLKSITGHNGVPALLSNQVQIASIGGSDVLPAVAQGSKIKYVLTLSPVFTFQLWAQKKYANADALKHQRVGITSTSGSLYIGTVLGLQAIGLTPTDVQMVSLGSVPNVDSAMIAGTIAATASHPPATYKYKQKGDVLLYDLAAKGVGNANTGFAVTDSYASSHPKVVGEAAAAIIQALHREKTDKTYTEQIMKKYMGITDQAILDFTYDFYAHEVAPTIPVPAVNQFTSAQKVLAQTNPKVASVDLSSFIDPSFVEGAAKALGVSASASPSS
jgi:NitT/TauT family transport system substrate-binding protein